MAQKPKFIQYPKLAAGGPAPAVQTPVQSRAALEAQRVLNPQLEEIRRQQAMAAQAAQRDQQAISGLNEATRAALAGIGPELQTAYQGAAQGIGSLARGFSEGMGERMAAGEGANAAFSALQGQSFAPGVNVPDAQNALYGLTGFIPGSALEREGASAGRWGAGLGAVEAAVGREMLSQRLAESSRERADFDSQLRQVQGTYPAEYDESLRALRSLGLEQQGLALDRKSTNAEIAAGKRDEKRAWFDSRTSRMNAATQRSAQDLYAEQFGEEKRQNLVDEELDRLDLGLESARDKAKLNENAKKGKTIDASASRVAGHIVYKDGTVPKGKNGKPIPVAEGGSSSTSKKKSDSFRKATAEAREMLGTPLENESALSPGRFVAKSGATGSDVYPSPLGNGRATTDNPAKAAREGGQDMTFVEALNYVQRAYGMKRAEARKALIAAGWKPDGQRPKADRSYDAIESVRGQR